MHIRHHHSSKWNCQLYYRSFLFQEKLSPALQQLLLQQLQQQQQKLLQKVKIFFNLFGQHGQSYCKTLIFDMIKIFSDDIANTEIKPNSKLTTLATKNQNIYLNKMTIGCLLDFSLNNCLNDIFKFFFQKVQFAALCCFFWCIIAKYTILKKSNQCFFLLVQFCSTVLENCLRRICLLLTKLFPGGHVIKLFWVPN
jgi:hypothetical protein